MGNIVDLNTVRSARLAAGKEVARRPPSNESAPARKSSVIAAVDYDEESAELDVTFTTGKKYRYFEVPAEVYYEFADAPSKGEFFNTRIRDRYGFSEILPRR